MRLFLPSPFRLIVFVLLFVEGCNPSQSADDAIPGYSKPHLYAADSQSNATIDSIAQTINALPDDSAKCNALYAIAWSIYADDTVAARTYANYLLWLASEINYRTGIARGEYLLGRLAEDGNDLQSAIAHLKLSIQFADSLAGSEESMYAHYWLARCYRRIADYGGYNENLTHLKAIATQRNNPEYLAYAYEGFGNLYRYLGDYTQSLNNYEKALTFTEATGDLEQKSTTLNNMSLSYEYLGDLDNSLRVQLENYEVIQEMKKPELLVLCLSNLCASYLQLHQPELARRYIAMSLSVLHSLDPGEVPLKDVASLYSQCAWIAEIDDHPDSALFYYRKSLQLSTEIQDTKAIADRFGDIGDVQEKLGRRDSAKYYYRKKLGITNDIGFRKGQIDAYDALSTAEFNSGNFEAAYGYLRKAETILDSLQTLNSTARASEMATWYKLKEQEQKIELLSRDKQVQDARIRQKESIAYALASGMMLVIFMTVVIYRNFRRKHRANRELENQVTLRTEELTRRNRDLKNFLYKSSHDLRSPIASIKGLINIAYQDAGDVTALRSHLEKMNAVIEKQDASLTTLLKISRLIEGKIEPVDIYFEELLDEIIAQQKDGKNCTDIDIISDVPSGLMVHTDRVILTSIIQNLLSNAVKYKRRRGAERSYVKITARPLGSDITIEVQDNGEGIPEHWHDKVFDLFSRGTATGEGAGLGLYIVQSSVDLLKGKLHFESTFGKGTTFILMLSRRMKEQEL